MIVIGADDVECALSLPESILARKLLSACAAEMRYQSAAMNALDIALGEMLLSLRQAADGAGGEPRLPSALLRHLQRADHTRQEVEGIAQALSLLASTGSLDDILPSDLVRDCSPVVALQRRLLAPDADANSPATKHEGSPAT